MEQRSGNNLFEAARQTINKFKERTAEAERKFTESNGSSGIGFFQKQDIEKTAAFEIAKENNLWINDIYSLGEPFDSGNENTVLLNESEGVVYKSNNLMNVFGSISTLFDTIEAHNQIFPETHYEIVGFTGFENKNRAPYIEVVLKQLFVDNAEHVSYQETADFMQYRGFRQINNHTFENNQYIVFDLHPRNVLKNSEGTIFVIDNRIEIKNQTTK